ncbi:MAG TPA: helix-turn-helix domain-containing protein [Gaiellaceae bacterium]|nr:helix-turn-helix domain-containing protein [Gaiellaceae bacterium]
MFQIGPSLREARTRRGLSPGDVHKAIRIRERYLSALEEERWEQLPGDAYIKGFLRTYAEFLGLDGQLYVDEYNHRFSRPDEGPAVPETLRRSSRRGGSGRMLRAAAALVVVAALAAGIAAWRHGGAQPNPTLPGAAAAAAPRHRTKPPARPKPAPAKPKPTSTVIRAATDDSWLSVRIGGPTGREIYRGILVRGGQLRFGLARPIWVRMGRPEALEITIGGSQVASLPQTPANLLLTRDGARAA